MTDAHATQTFNVLAGADILLLGFANGVGFNDCPSYYGGNAGRLSAPFDIAVAAAVALPAGLPLLLSALGIAGLLRRR